MKSYIFSSKTLLPLTLVALLFPVYANAFSFDSIVTNIASGVSESFSGDDKNNNVEEDKKLKEQPTTPPAKLSKRETFKKELEDAGFTEEEMAFALKSHDARIKKETEEKQAAVKKKKQIQKEKKLADAKRAKEASNKPIVANQSPSKGTKSALKKDRRAKKERMKKRHAQEQKTQQVKVEQEKNYSNQKLKEIISDHPEIKFKHSSNIQNIDGFNKIKFGSSVYDLQPLADEFSSQLDTKIRYVGGTLAGTIAGVSGNQNISHDGVIVLNHFFPLLGKKRTICLIPPTNV